MLSTFFNSQALKIAFRNGGTGFLADIMMISCMCRIVLKKIQVFWSVIAFLFINVMDNFVSSKWSANNFFCYFSVLSFSAMPNITKIIRSYYSFCIRAVTKITTEAVDSGFTSVKFLIAFFAMKRHQIFSTVGLAANNTAKSFSHSFLSFSAKKFFSTLIARMEFFMFSPIRNHTRLITKEPSSRGTGNSRRGDIDILKTPCAALGWHKLEVTLASMTLQGFIPFKF